MLLSCICLIFQFHVATASFLDHFIQECWRHPADLRVIEVKNLVMILKIERKHHVSSLAVDRGCIGSGAATAHTNVTDFDMTAIPTGFLGSAHDRWLPLAAVASNDNNQTLVNVTDLQTCWLVFHDQRLLRLRKAISQLTPP